MTDRRPETPDQPVPSDAEQTPDATPSAGGHLEGTHFSSGPEAPAHEATPHTGPATPAAPHAPATPDTPTQTYPGGVAPTQAYPPAAGYPGAPHAETPPAGGFAAPHTMHPGASAPAQGTPGAPGVAPYGTMPNPGGYPAPGAGGYPGATPGAPDADGATPPRKSRTTLWIVLGAALAALLLIIGGLFISRMVSGPSGGGAPMDDDRGTGPDSGLILAEADSPEHAVELYLTALSEGDAAQARAFVSEYEDVDLLTDEILADSLTRAPLAFGSATERGEAKYDGVIVTAQYTLGDKSVQQDFTVVDTYDGQWIIENALMRVSTPWAGDMDVTLNGHTLPADSSVAVFPGSYTFEIDSDVFEFSGENTILLARESDRDKVYDLEPQLNEEATAQFRALVRESVEACAEATTLVAPCGIDLSTGDLSGYTPVEDSVKRTIPAKTDKLLDNLKTRLDYDDPHLVTTSDFLQFDTTLKGKKGDEIAEFEVWMGGDPGRPMVDFSADELVVQWDAR